MNSGVVSDGFASDRLRHKPGDMATIGGRLDIPKTGKNYQKKFRVAKH
jgi:hypothetical protein